MGPTHRRPDGTIGRRAWGEGSEGVVALDYPFQIRHIARGMRVDVLDQMVQPQTRLDLQRIAPAIRAGNMGARAWDWIGTGHWGSNA